MDCAALAFWNASLPGCAVELLRDTLWEKETVLVAEEAGRKWLMRQFNVGLRRKRAVAEVHRRRDVPMWERHDELKREVVERFNEIRGRLQPPEGARLPERAPPVKAIVKAKAAVRKLMKPPKKGKEWRPNPVDCPKLRCCLPSDL